MTLAARLTLSASLCALPLAAQAAPSPTLPPPLETVAHLHDYQVVEFRRYVTAAGRRGDFARYFDAYFPEAFEQLGALVFGQFAERGDPERFTWLRGFHDLQARPVVNAAFYYGPLWREHRAKVNAILPDSDNVMLMRPLRRGRGVAVLPAVDPVVEPGGAGGIVVAQVFAVEKDRLDAFAARAEHAFAAYDGPGVQGAGVLVSLDVPNNFPQLPVREDGPWLVWLGVCRDEAALRALSLRLETIERELGAGGALRGPVERIVMDPTPRSRLRWLPFDATAAQDAP